MNALPILYSFRRCPYAIRARMALAVAGIAVELREVLLRDKPLAMLEASAKGTVPVLVLTDGQVIDESLDVMRWALEQYDPEHWLADERSDGRLLVACDEEFKPWLDRYKYADRYPEQTPDDYRGHAENFLICLEGPLGRCGFLAGDKATLKDVALLPFVRQFAGVDPDWWRDAPYPGVRRWLNGWLVSEVFTSVMAKYPRWQSGAPGVVFPDNPKVRK